MANKTKGQTLDEFVAELRRDVDAFEKWWREQNSKNPEHFEMSFPEENSGIWFEQFLYFMTEGVSERVQEDPGAGAASAS